jgi:DNA-binding SARP family transcriptional activator
LPALERATNGGMTLFTAPAGYLPTESLAVLLVARDRPILWVRLGLEDRDPATLLMSLIAAMQRLCPDAGKATLEQMRRQPGPLLGWPPIFANLSQELTAALGMNGALVIEGCHHLADTYQTLQLLSAHVLSTLTPAVACILTAERPLPPIALPASIAYRNVGDLRLSIRESAELLSTIGCQLTADSIRRAITLTEGRASALIGLCAAVEMLGPAPVQRAIDRAADLTGLLTCVARAWLVMSDAVDQQALTLALHLGYVHPELLATAVGTPKLPSGPWFEMLEGGWLRIQTVWQAPLRKELRSRAIPDHQALRQAAAHLVEYRAFEQAIALYFELDDRTHAAEAINSTLEVFLSLGYWETLDEWLSQLPAPILEERPCLVYVSGELAAVQGQIEAAQRAFHMASRLFEAQHHTAGSCQSLLAESTLAAWRNDLARAESYALAASALAKAAGMPWQHGWAVWQLGCLAAAADDLDAALVYFGQAQDIAATINEPLMLELPRQAELLVMHWRDLRHKREYHRKAYWAVEQAEQAADDHLHRLLEMPQYNVDALLETHGWARLPLMLKLVAPSLEAEPLAIADRSSLWSRLLSMLGLRRDPQLPAPAARIDASFGAPPPPRSSVYADHELVMSSLSFDATLDALSSAAATDDMTLATGADPLYAVQAGTTEAPPAAAQTEASLSVYMLGSFRVIVNDRLVDSWPSGRGRSVLKYLLAHRARPAPRDVLMDLFWPEADPESARNSLNVAIHGLRQAFRALDEIAVVLFENGAYRLNPDLTIWLDVEEFERHIQAACQLEESGQLSAAMTEYEVAIGLYNDDFLLDDPYEDWPVLTRERLRVMYLEALDRLGRIYFAQGQFAACSNLCQLMLATDNCREDAHCRLMRCYARLGQYPLALRQYQVCVEALHTELDIEPSLETTDLYERIRRREAV